jgi:PAS domain S-box-containing protein
LHEDTIVEQIEPGKWSFVGVSMDVTDRKRADEDLRRSEEHFRRIFEESPMGIVITDVDMNFLEVNTALSDMMGYQREDMVGLALDAVTHPNDMTRSANAAERIETGPVRSVQLDKRYVRRDGSTFWAQTTAAPLHDASGQMVGRIGMIEDITVRRRSESLRVAMHEISEAAHEAADISDLVQSIHTAVGRVLDARGFAVGLIDPSSGEQPGDIPGWIHFAGGPPPRPLNIRTTRSGRALAEQRPMRFSRAGTLALIASGEMELGDGPVGSWCGAPLMVGGEAIGIVRLRNDAEPDAYDDEDCEILNLVASQIASAFSRQRAVDELKHQRELFQALMDHSTDTIIFKDRESRFLRVSRRDAAGLGFDNPDDMVGMSDANFWRPSMARQFREAELAVMESGEPVVGQISRHPTDDDLDIWSSSTKIPMRNADGAVTGIIAVSHDVSDVMNAQEALRDSEEQRKGLMRQVLTVQEEERARIARELHDQVGQDLASVLVGLRVIESAEAAEAAQRQAVTLRDRTASTLEDVRKIAFDMRPNSLDDLGLAVALERALSVLAEQSGFTPTMRVHDPDGVRLGADAELGIYRVVHAAIANAARHADAENVSVVMRLSDGAASVIVEDDGRGFDVEAVLSGPVDQRFGLLAMQERMQMLGGQITIDSTQGEGAVIFIELNPD